MSADFLDPLLHLAGKLFGTLPIDPARRLPVHRSPSLLDGFVGASGSRGMRRTFSCGKSFNLEPAEDKAPMLLFGRIAADIRGQTGMEARDL